jgi:nucleotide sugar dehydrogenase
MYSVGIIGLGFVGGAMFKSFQLKEINTVGYDKYKNGGIGSLEDILKTDFVFLCLPTLFDEIKNCYNKDAIYEVCNSLQTNNYKGIVIIKSTVEPETTNNLTNKYDLKFIHNPEFLTARTAFKDFHNQKHIVLGIGSNCSEKNLIKVKDFYSTNFPLANISTCNSLESESMKIMCNSFYASKIMLFNEYYLLCKKNGSDFNVIKKLMLKNDWINSMHTNIPGPDGKLGYGGACFPKDTKALYQYMKSQNLDSIVLESVIKQNEKVRNEKQNNLKVSE